MSGESAAQGVDGFVLAGGRSRRMGFDKARAAWGTVPLAVATARSLAAVCGRVALVRRQRDQLPWIEEDGRPIDVLWEEISEAEHPLWGVYTALSAARSEVALLAPCDVPSLSPQTLQRLLVAAPSVASDGERLHPLVAALPRLWAARAEQLARQGAPAWKLVESARPVLVDARELADHDDPSSLPPSPVERLLARIPLTHEAARARLEAGEVARLAARGIVHPRSAAHVRPDDDSLAP